MTTTPTTTNIGRAGTFFAIRAPSGAASAPPISSPNTTGQAALHASAGLLLDFGMERVASAILQNTERLMTELVRIDGIRLNSRTAPARRSGIVSFGHETIAPGTLYQGLRERGISCALREGGVRVSPHFYQGESELTVFLDALAHIV